MFDKTETLTLQVEGMTCPHCVQHVQEALKAVQGREKRKGQPGGEKRPGDLCAGQDRKRGTDKGGGSRRIHGKLSREKGTL